jgi:hypothetical protein
MAGTTTIGAKLTSYAPPAWSLALRAMHKRRHQRDVTSYRTSVLPAKVARQPDDSTAAAASALVTETLNSWGYLRGSKKTGRTLPDTTQTCRPEHVHVFSYKTYRSYHVKALLPPPDECHGAGLYDYGELDLVKFESKDSPAQYIRVLLWDSGTASFTINRHNLDCWDLRFTCDMAEVQLLHQRLCERADANSKRGREHLKQLAQAAQTSVQGRDAASVAVSVDHAEDATFQVDVKLSGLTQQAALRIAQLVVALRDSTVAAYQQASRQRLKARHRVPGKPATGLRRGARHDPLAKLTPKPRQP